MSGKETYPYKCIKTIRLKDGTIVKLRPIKPEDEPLMLELFKTFSPETIKFRFLPLREITHEDLVRYCNVDYKNEIAIVAEIKEDNDNKKRLIGVARLIRDKEKQSRVCCCW